MDKVAKDLVITLALVIMWTWLVYDKGVEDGYWEHEGEENSYSCRVYDERITT